MDKHVFYFQDENLSAEKASRGALKMIFGAEGLTMLALSAENEVLGLASIQISDKKVDNQYGEPALPEVLAGQQLLRYPYGSVNAAISTPLATLVPHRLFSEQACPKYFHLLQPTNQETIFGHEAIKDFGCQLVWAAPATFKPLVQQYQPRHLGGSLIQQFHALSSPEGYSIFMNVRSNLAQIIVFDTRNLVFYNTFEFNKPADLLYYVLLVFDQFRINPEQVPLQVSGALMEGTEHFNMLHKYVQKIVFITPKAIPNLPKSDKALPAHYWFDLLSL
jgi:hypothetical protein